MQVQRRETLHKSERLCSEKRIEALFSGGRRGTVAPLRFCFIVSEGVEAAASTGVAVSGEAVSGEALMEARLPEEAEAITSGEAAVSVLFSVPKKAFKRAWKRNLIKRRMRESYRKRKHALADAVRASGRHIDIALICMPSEEIPDYATIDNAIAKILDKIPARI